MKFGWILVAAGVLIWIAVAMAGGNATPLWLSLVGLLLVAVGFGRRILAALESKPTPANN